MTRRGAIAAIAVLAASCGRWRAGVVRAAQVAFSLGEAERRIKAGRDLAAIRAMGGVSRLLGAVHDPQARDVILVGVRRDNREPVSLDDVVVGLRAIVGRHEWPLVSIDRTPDTARTGKQKVRFDGVPDSAFARQLLASDVTLKKAALNVIELPITSYFELCMEAARRDGLDAHVSSRLWFWAPEASLLVRDDVVAIRRLRVGVKTEVMNGLPGERDEISDRYAAAFTDHFEQIGRQYPEIRCLPGLFEIVAVCHGLEMLGARHLGYWLNDYSVPAVHIATDFDVLRHEQPVETAHGRRMLEIEGGIDTRLQQLRLSSGDHGAFRDAVLRSRPAADALIWDVPLHGWRFADERPAAETGASAPVGAHLDRRVSALPAADRAVPRGGVKADVEIRPEDFREMR